MRACVFKGLMRVYFTLIYAPPSRLDAHVPSTVITIHAQRRIPNDLFMTILMYTEIYRLVSLNLLHAHTHVPFQVGDWG